MLAEFYGVVPTNSPCGTNPCPVCSFHACITLPPCAATPPASTVGDIGNLRTIILLTLYRSLASPATILRLPTLQKTEALTELCLAFEGIVPRESIIAALTACSHDATAAAQLLLDPAPEMHKQGSSGRGGRGRKSSKGKNGRHRERGRAAAQSERKTSCKYPATSLIGATCDRAGGVGGRGRQSAGEGWGEEEEEEEGDEGLHSEEYRTRANDAAEEMRAWFQKAAEAFTSGGR